MNLFHCSRCKPSTRLVTFCGHLHGGVLSKDARTLAKTNKPVYYFTILSFKYVIHKVC